MSFDLIDVLLTRSKTCIDSRIIFEALRIKVMNYMNLEKIYTQTVVVSGTNMAIFTFPVTSFVVLNARLTIIFSMLIIINRIT